MDLWNRVIYYDLHRKNIKKGQVTTILIQSIKNFCSRISDILRIFKYVFIMITLNMLFHRRHCKLLSVD